MSAELAYLTDRLAPREEPAASVSPEGEHRRFERIVKRHHARLRRVAAGVLDERDRVDDVLQEAYLKAYRRLPSRFENEAHEATWLYRVVVRCCLDDLRRGRRRPQRAAVEPERLHAVGRDGLAPVVLDRAFRRLGAEDRAVLLLIELLGLDYETAASVLGARRGTVASRLNRARSRFRAALEAEGVRDGDR
ncbi:MAG TPA: sigma-70 family RNA polymerase sigma factor [Gaiellaceae bacterium]|nr:sigma-70 family RNA polymerase sigma factor [Gaiellaceae bacterium]